jgi:Flp pilus assembly protein CpaB
MKRSNMIVALGLAVFVVGAGATYFVLKDKDSGASAATNATVLYAAQAIPAGTSGSNALNEGKVKTKTVEASAATGALTDPSQLVGKTAASAVPEGLVLTATQFPQTQTVSGALKIPDGKTALAVQLGYIPGVAGFAQAGDRIDIFGISSNGGGGTRLVLQNTEVLNISAPTVTAGAPAGGEPVYLLAVSPTEAEQVIYMATFHKLYFSLVPRDQAPVPGTPGSGQPDALTLLP